MKSVEEKKRRSLILFLHGLGYTYFNINNLTIMETNELVQAWNEEQTQKKQQKKSVRHGNQITTQLL